MLMRLIKGTGRAEVFMRLHVSFRRHIKACASTNVEQRHGLGLKVMQASWRVEQRNSFTGVWFRRFSSLRAFQANCFLSQLEFLADILIDTREAYSSEEEEAENNGCFSGAEIKRMLDENWNNLMYSSITRSLTRVSLAFVVLLCSR